MSLQYIWYGHATHSLEVAGTKILVDPYFNDNPASPIKAEEVSADYILVSHGHFDHVTDLIDVARNTGATVITNFEIANWLGEKDIPAHAQHIGGGHHHPFGYLKLTQALHGSGLPDFAYGGSPCGFLLTTKANQKVYLACDTGLFGDMRLIGDEGIDLAVLPIGDNFTMGPDDALKAVKLIRPKHVIPVHYNTWPLIAQDADAWAGRVRAETDSQVHVLKPGEHFDLA
jgi:L-ascorbate metabolism protein UlaG (beta-lactamase superfamily)